MKIVKYFFLLLLLLVATISIFVATKNGNYIVNKSIIIDVPKPIVFNYVSDSKNWETINPWKNEKIKIKLFQKIDNETLLKSIVINEVNSEIKFTFRDTLSKKTIVIWSTQGTLSFKDKFLSIINKASNNNFDEKFENGLTALNKILTTEINTFNIKIDGFVNRDTIYYIQKALVCKVDELPNKIKSVIPKLEQLLVSTNTQKNGSPFLVYHAQDTLTNIVKVSVAIPTKIKIFTSPESDIYNGQTNPFQAVKATLKGNYNHKKEAVKELEDFMFKNRLERSDRNKIIEIMTTNITSEKYASKWITEIYIPVRPKKTTIRVIPVKKDSINTVIESSFPNPTNTENTK